MNKLNQLIRELCPDGVEYLDISEVTSVERGIRVVKNQLTETGDYPVYQNSLKPLGYHTQSNCSGGTAFVIGAGAAGEIGYSKVDFWAADDCYYFQHSIKLDSRYLYHALLSKQHLLFSKVRKASIPRLSRSVIQHLQIPVPPLEVQQEIVRILDSFTELTTKLTTELTAELTARKQQYEYYRDELLTFDIDDTSVVWKPLGEIATIARGASPRPIKNFITESEDGVNWIKIGDVLPNTKYISSTKEKITPEGAEKSRHVYSGDFILSNSMSFGRPYILKTDGCIHDGWLSISGFEEYTTPDYLYYVLISTPIQREMEKKASFGGAVQNLNAEIVRDIKIPLPPLAVQKNLANILDHFDVLCNGLSNGLPAEIEARQKQYEYYRDKLLTFKEKMA